MHLLNSIFALALFTLLLVALIWSQTWLNGSYQKYYEWVRWIVFLPISIARAVLAASMLFINMHYVFPLKESIALGILWVVVPILFFYTIGITIPRGKKVTPVVLCVLWIILDMLSVINGDSHEVIRGIQIVALGFFLFIWVRMSSEDLYKQL